MTKYINSVFNAVRKVLMCENNFENYKIISQNFIQEKQWIKNHVIKANKLILRHITRYDKRNILATTLITNMFQISKLFFFIDQKLFRYRLYKKEKQKN